MSEVVIAQCWISYEVLGCEVEGSIGKLLSLSAGIHIANKQKIRQGS